MKRKANKAKKMAEGGEMKPKPSPSPEPKHDKNMTDEEKLEVLKAMPAPMAEGGEVENDPNLPGAKDFQDSFRKKTHYAKGGDVSDQDDDLVMRIMNKRYSKGGMVANESDEYADEMPNEFDELVLGDDLESTYSGANSGDELGDEQEDEDRKDIVSRIMKSRSKKDRMPNPA